MKKLLGFLGAIGLVATSSATVVACGPDTKDSDSITKDITVTKAGVTADNAANNKLFATALGMVKEDGTPVDGFSITIFDTEAKMTALVDKVDAATTEAPVTGDIAGADAMSWEQVTASEAENLFYVAGIVTLNDDGTTKTLDSVSHTGKVTLSVAGPALSTIITETSLELAEGTDLTEASPFATIKEAIKTALTAKYANALDVTKLNLNMSGEDNAKVIISSLDETVYSGSVTLDLTVATAPVVTPVIGAINNLTLTSSDGTTQPTQDVTVKVTEVEGFDLTKIAATSSNAEFVTVSANADASGKITITGLKNTTEAITITLSDTNTENKATDVTFTVTVAGFSTGE